MFEVVSGEVKEMADAAHAVGAKAGKFELHGTGPQFEQWATGWMQKKLKMVCLRLIH